MKKFSANVPTPSFFYHFKLLLSLHALLVTWTAIKRENIINKIYNKQIWHAPIQFSAKPVRSKIVKVNGIKFKRFNHCVLLRSYFQNFHLSKCNSN